MVGLLQSSSRETPDPLAPSACCTGGSPGAAYRVAAPFLQAFPGPSCLPVPGAPSAQAQAASPLLQGGAGPGAARVRGRSSMGLLGLLHSAFFGNQVGRGPGGWGKSHR